MVQQLYFYSRISFMELITEGEDEISKANDLQSGTVTISVTETALHGVMLPLLNEFHERYPGIKIKLLNHSTPQALTALKSGIIKYLIIFVIYIHFITFLLYQYFISCI